MLHLMPERHQRAIDYKTKLVNIKQDFATEISTTVQAHDTLTFKYNFLVVQMVNKLGNYVIH